MNFPAKIHRDSEHLEIDIAESLRLLWKQRGIVLLFSAISTAVAVTYVLLAEPQYKVQRYIRPVA